MLFDHDAWHLIRPRDGIALKAVGQQMPRLVVHDFLAERLANAQCYAAVELPAHDWQIDDRSRVVDDGIALYGYDARLHIDVHYRGVSCASIGRRAFRCEDVGCTKRNAGEPGLSGDFSQSDAAVRLRPH